MRRSRRMKLIPLALLVGAQLALAQPLPTNEKVKSLKIAFITEQLELTSGEAQKFWPIYNSFEDQLLALGEDEQDILLLTNAGNLSDSEARKQIDRLSSIREKRYKLEQKFLSDLKGTLPDRKILRLALAEEEFKRQLLRRFREGGGAIRRRN